MSEPPPSPNAVAWFNTHLKKKRQSFGVQLPKPIDVALSLIPQVRILESYNQSIRESFTSTLESNCKFARRLTHLAIRIFIERFNCRCCAWCAQVLESRILLAPNMSGVALESNFQFRPHFVCLPVFVLQALESNCQFGQADWE